jgi:hypothetical protein
MEERKMARIDQLGKTATRVYQEDGYTCVRYHATDVVRFNEHYIELDTGGWETPTTKLRMNQASNQFKLGFRVYQRDYIWHVATDDGYDFPFNGEAIICRCKLHGTPAS